MAESIKPRLRNRHVMKFRNTKKTSFYTDFLTEDIINYVEVKQIKLKPCLK